MNDSKMPSVTAIVGAAYPEGHWKERAEKAEEENKTLRNWLVALYAFEYFSDPPIDTFLFELEQAEENRQYRLKMMQQENQRLREALAEIYNSGSIREAERIADTALNGEAKP